MAASPAVTQPGARSRYRIPVRGMSCAACATRIEKVLSGLAGVEGATVNLALGTAEVELRDGSGIAPVAEAIRKAGYEPGLVRRTLVVRGMSCAACVRRVEKALLARPGVVEASVNLALGRAEVSFVEGALEPQALVDAVREAGYEAEFLEEGGRPAVETAGSRDQALILLASLLLTLPLVAQMIWRVLGVPFHLPPWLELALATPVQLVAGARFYRGAWKALRARSGNMDVLIALGTTTAYLYSLALMIDLGEAAAGRLYFEASAVIITVTLLGKWLEERAKRGAAEAIRRLMELRPERARLLRDDVEVEVPVAEVRVGDLVIVRPGERVPVDGEIVEGASEFDESLVTGESLPVARGPGETAISGSLNGTGLIRLRAVRVGEDTTLARIARLVEQAQAGKAPIQRLVDRVAAVFVPAVLAVAAFTFTSWLLLGGSFESALVAAVSVLVIACPCALGLATPTALVAGTGSAARAGILIRDIETLERAHRTGVVVFDKTGTLTAGRPSLLGILPWQVREEELLRVAAGAQAGSEHPLGRAIVEGARARGIEVPPPEAFEAVPGEGARARVAGVEVRVGRRHFALAGDGVPPEVARRAAELEEQGQTVVWVSRAGRLLGLLALADELRPDAAEAVARLRARGVEVVMMSGDNRRTAERIAARCGIARVLAPVRPEDKAREVQRLQGEGRTVAMVGDGINDAPALAAADVGIAMGGGADVALETAGITLMRPRPLLVPAALDIARATHRKIWQNLFWAFVYNLVGIPLAALGRLDPAIAGIAMALSSVSVVTNSLLLRSWKPRIEEKRK